ncbi:MAG: tetraacyldisaccharide 4'-kinase [Methylobacterium mesophilicum]|nr:tetraacyldisaccharide 4'-kinase [Methylobacterium mesophilicum]
MALGSAPRFWSEPPGLCASLLSPLAAFYGAVAASRLRNAPRVPAGLPVICVGNPTVGGTGKTPLSIALAEAAGAMGLKPGFLSRGHGGGAAAPRLVGPSDTALSVGDEPMLLAAHAPTAVSPDRAAAADLLRGAGCDLAIMDDGFQSARIRFDLALLAVDAAAGLGNGKVLPAGPLRAPAGLQLDHAHAVIAVGEGQGADGFLGEAKTRRLPVHRARLATRNPQAVAGRSLLAFAGIGRPEKFFQSLEEAGAVVAERRSFADHHPFRREELDGILREARSRHLTLATTAKDLIRLGPVASAAFLENLVVLEVEARFRDERTSRALIEQALKTFSAS